MKRLLLVVACGLAVCLMLLNAPTAAALMIALPPTPPGQRLARAEVTVLGTVTAIEEKTVSASQFPGSKDKVEYYVATVKVDEAISGAKGLTHIKVAYLAPPKVDPNLPKDRPIRPIRPGFAPPTLTKGQEAMLFLKQHHAENFYIIANNEDVIDKKAGDYKTALEEVKKSAKLLDDPKKALKGDSKDERFAVMGMLLARYRTQPISADPSAVKQEEIDAEESKLILAALAEANWNAPVRFAGPFTTPMGCFQALGLTEKDGWSFKGGNFNDAAQKWLKDNGGKYRVKKFVLAEKK